MAERYREDPARQTRGRKSGPHHRRTGLSICRQTGKSFMICGALFGLSVNHPGLLAIWTAHHSATSDEIFMSMAAFASRSKIAPFVKKVYSGAGDEEIRFHNGSRIMFGARERGFGRGMSGVDVLVNDEGQIMSQKAMQNMLAIMNTSKLGLHIYAGTPPKPEDDSETWMTMHDEAWSDEAVDMAWIEMGADDDADLDDVDQSMKANCSIPTAPRSTRSRGSAASSTTTDFAGKPWESMTPTRPASSISANGNA